MFLHHLMLKVCEYFIFHISFYHHNVCFGTMHSCQQVWDCDVTDVDLQRLYLLWGNRGKPQMAKPSAHMDCRLSDVPAPFVLIIREWTGDVNFRNREHYWSALTQFILSGPRIFCFLEGFCGVGTACIFAVGMIHLLIYFSEYYV